MYLTKVSFFSEFKNYFWIYEDFKITPIGKLCFYKTISKYIIVLHGHYKNKMPIYCTMYKV
jgi:hypothetical protein